MARSKQTQPAEPSTQASGADPQAQQQQQQQDDPTREQRIREAAYAAAERRGFAPGGEVDDWLEAERQMGGTGAPRG
ncbi:DUF2934 domain-containing protein [Pseudorhodoferax sp.]|uniref:DUF2934 domain-containing protein n=1 Tax=Pseudorhodoferax sp. TaxID=1993553 RepID=UPI002DD69425|nr:DUF2934 domain-containing protein [Pseudorhodoferax sp.]